MLKIGDSSVEGVTDSSEEFNLEQYLESPKYLKVKEEFSTIFSQVIERKHLATGYITYDCVLPSVGNVTIRTLRASERDFITLNTTVEADSTNKEATKLSILHANLRFLFCVEDLGDVNAGEDWHIKVPKADVDFDTWYESDQIQQKISSIGNLGQFLEETITALINQVTFVTNTAMAEQVKNLSTPKQPSDK